MYTPEIYVVEWLKEILLIRYRISSLLYASNITNIYLVLRLDQVVLTSLTHPPKEVCCGLHPLMNQRGALALVQTPAASSWPTPFQTVPSTREEGKHRSNVFQSFSCPFRTTPHCANIFFLFWSRPHGLNLSSCKGGVLRATPPYKPKGCTRAGQNTSRVLVANAMSDSS
jgi:hypothetical protein